MDNDSQIHIPDSFMALYLLNGRSKPNAMREVIAARYELCEDLANHLVEHASSTLHAHGIAEDEVLVRCHRGLLSEDSGVSPAEAAWITRRLAELLTWPCPVFVPGD
jgi:hypothetical protein